MAKPRVAVFGAAGLIGAAVVRDLAHRGFPVIAVARRFGPADLASAADTHLEAAFATMSAEALAATLGDAEVVVNAVGVLQSAASGSAETAHFEFPQRLIAALKLRERPTLLVHVSIPGAEAGQTAFSRTKMQGELAIQASGLPYVILRPGFVIAAAAYGGGALVRGLAGWPFDLPAAEREQPFRIVALADVTATAAWAAQAWGGGRRTFAADFDVMSLAPTTVGEVVDAYRRHFGGPPPRWVLPSLVLDLGARLADAVGALGWRAPIRSTALAEMRRGVSGDPRAWMAQTGLSPRTLAQALAGLEPSAQERWFANLYLLKPLLLATLAAFYGLSGAIGLTAGFAAAKSALIARGFSPPAAVASVAATSLADLAVAAMIAVAPLSRRGLQAALALALAYLVAGTALAPDLWADPLGPLLKVLPVLALCAAALAVSGDR